MNVPIILIGLYPLTGLHRPAQAGRFVISSHKILTHHMVLSHCQRFLNGYLKEVRNVPTTL